MAKGAQLIIPPELPSGGRSAVIGRAAAQATSAASTRTPPDMPRNTLRIGIPLDHYQRAEQT